LEFHLNNFCESLIQNFYYANNQSETPILIEKQYQKHLNEYLTRRLVVVKAELQHELHYFAGPVACIVT